MTNVKIRLQQRYLPASRPPADDFFDLTFIKSI
jgi:hypothetical protein